MSVHSTQQTPSSRGHHCTRAVPPPFRGWSQRLWLGNAPPTAHHSPVTSADLPGEAHDAITLESLLLDLCLSPLTILSATMRLERSPKVQLTHYYGHSRKKIAFPLDFPLFPGGSKVGDIPTMGTSTLWDSLDWWWIQLHCKWRGGWSGVQWAFPSLPQHGEQLSRDVVPSEHLTHMGEWIYPLSGRENIITATRKWTAERLNNLPNIKD